MDTSKEYILMCEKAWKYLKREIYFSDIVFMTNHDGSGGFIATNWTQNSPASWGYVENVQYPNNLHKRMCQCQNCHGFVIWRQDQLQDMVSKEWKVGNLMQNVISLTNKIHKFSENTFKNGEPYFSMEQLWLAFVMHEKYSRGWNGSEWGLINE